MKNSAFANVEKYTTVPCRLAAVTSSGSALWESITVELMLLGAAPRWERNVRC